MLNQNPTPPPTLAEQDPLDSPARPVPETLTGRNRWAALAFLAAAVSLIVVDGTIVNVALPVIVHDLSLGFSQAEWITTIYALVFSALLITMGRIADTLGRKTILLGGITIFIAASALAGWATTPEALILARAIQGIGGAAVLPTTLSTVNTVFRGRSRAIAFAVWGSVISGMAAVGPLLGGWLTTSFSWPWIFYVNLPLGIIIALGVLIFVPQTKGAKQGRGIDVDGFLLSSIGLGALVFALIEGRTYGWWIPLTPTSLPISRAGIGLVIGISALILFIFWERHRARVGRSRLLDLNLFRLRSFSLGNIAAGAIATGEFGLLFVLPLYLQNVLGSSALQAGFVLAAMAVGAFLAGGMAGPLAHKTSPATVAALGLGIEIIGLAGLASLSMRQDSSSFSIAFWLVVYGIGLGMASAQLTSTVLAEVPPAQSGQGSATQSTVRQIGAALGIAIVATFLASSIAIHAPGSLKGIEGIAPAAATSLEKSLAPSAGSILPGVRSGTGVSAPLSSTTRDQINQRLGHTFATSSAQAIWLATGFIAVGFLATLGLRRSEKQRS